MEHLQNLSFKEIWNYSTLGLLIIVIIFNLAKSRQKEINKILLGAAFLLGGMVLMVEGKGTPIFFVGSITIFIVTFFFKKKKKQKKQEYSAPDLGKYLTDHSFFFLTKVKALTDHPMIVLSNPFRNIFISGGAGSGKSKSLIEPIIKTAAMADYSILLYDYESPVLSQSLCFQLAQQGKDLYYINFDKLDYSNRVNPISPKTLPNVSYSREAASTIINNLMPETISKPDFWSRSSISLFQGIIWYLRNNHPDKCTLPHAISMVLYPDTEHMVKTISKDMEVQGIVASIYSAMVSKANNQIAGVIGSLQNAISTLATMNIFWILAGEDFTLDLNNPENPKSLSVGNTPQVAETYAPVISLIMSTALKLMNQQGQHHSVSIIDEGSTLYIPNLAKISATSRKNKLATVFCTQDLSQFKDLYGEEQMQTCLSNMANHFYGRTTNPKTAQQYSQTFGKYDKMMQSISEGSSENSQGSSFSENITHSLQQRNWVEPQEFLELPPGNFIGFASESNVVKFKTTFSEPEGHYMELEKRNMVTEEMLKENFRRIKEDIEIILG